MIHCTILCRAVLYCTVLGMLQVTEERVADGRGERGGDVDLFWIISPRTPGT